LKLQQTLQNQQKKNQAKYLRKLHPSVHSSKFSHFKT
jgi:hypothetical protein